MAYLEVGENIRDIRKIRGLNQDQLAEMACLNRVTIAKYESGKKSLGKSKFSGAFSFIKRVKIG